MRLLFVLSACACVCSTCVCVPGPQLHACLGLNCIRPIGTQTHTVCLEGALPAAHTAAQPRTQQRCACNLSWMDGVFHSACTWFVVCCMMALSVPVSYCAEQAAHHTPCLQPSRTVAGRPFHPLVLTSFHCFVGLITPLNDRLCASVLASVDVEECLLPCVVQRAVPRAHCLGRGDTHSTPPCDPCLHHLFNTCTHFLCPLPLLVPACGSTCSIPCMCGSYVPACLCWRQKGTLPADPFAEQAGVTLVSSGVQGILGSSVLELVGLVARFMKFLRGSALSRHCW